jgi:hypothetical protein
VSGKSSESNTVDLAGKLHLDLTFQDRAILGGCEIRLKLNPHKPSFYFILEGQSNNLQLNVKWIDAFIEVHRSKVYEPIVAAHGAALKISPAKYPVNRFEVKQFTIPKGSIDSYVDHAITGQLPRRIYVALVSNSAFHGTLTSDPFKFQHFNLNYICAFYNGLQVPAKPYRPDFAKKLYVREYLGLFGTSNQLYSNAKCLIDRDSYADGYTIYGFNFSPDLSDDCNTTGHVSLIKRGTLRLELHFNPGVVEAVNVLIFAEYDSIIAISQDRNAVTDFS